MGSCLSFQLATRGLSIVMGSREPAKAQQLADQICKETQLNSVNGISNSEAERSIFQWVNFAYLGIVDNANLNQENGCRVVFGDSEC